MAKSTAIKFALFHSLLNGSAVLLGSYLSGMDEIVKGVCNAVAGGTFIYICMVEKINKEFHCRDGLVGKLGLVFAGLGFSILILH